jgi:hypothetical protein
MSAAGAADIAGCFRGGVGNAALPRWTEGGFKLRTNFLSPTPCNVCVITTPQRRGMPAAELILRPNRTVFLTNLTVPFRANFATPD